MTATTVPFIQPVKITAILELIPIATWPV